MVTLQAAQSPAVEVDPSFANSRSEIQARASVGRLTWSGPLLVIAGRSVFSFLAQVLVTLIFLALRNPDPFKAGIVWWQVTGTLVDLGCLALLFWLTSREGIRLRDLISLNKKKLGRDILMGLGLVIVVFPIAMIGGGMLSGLLVYGKLQPTLPGGLLTKSLPLWAALYARLLWWPIWSVVEEMVYNGYALPRLQVLTGGRTWLAVLVVAFGWAIQHAFLPFIPDLKVFLYLFIQMIPLVIVAQLIYLRFRRLPANIVMHWCMDLFSAVAMIKVV